jgi:hypothetical protein
MMGVSGTRTCEKEIRNLKNECWWTENTILMKWQHVTLARLSALTPSTPGLISMTQPSYSWSAQNTISMNNESSSKI